MKKFLSLVLALVMAMSLVTVSAGAKDFTDSEKLSGPAYEEAVNVMSEMGIIDGYADGSFQPQGTLTRGAAAKIIACMMLGKTTAEALGTQAAPFKDVPVGSTFAGYIAYCSESGIIDGYADGTFRPSNTLTGFAFLKMLLTALGYDSEIEGYANNPNWTVNVAGRAKQIGLVDGNEDFVGTQAATREEACLYAVNALQATLVEYSDKGTSITINGATISTGASNATYVTSNVYSAATSIDATKDNTTGDYTVEFAEKYQPKLALKADTDDFMRPAHTWSWDKKDIGTYVNYDEMVAEYTTGVTGKELYEVLTATTIKDSSLESYVDGAVGDIEKTDLVRTNNDDLADTDNGVLTQVFVNTAREEIVITSINTWLAEATASYSESKEYAPLKVYTGADGANKTFNVDVEDVPEVADVENETFYLVNISKKDIAAGEIAAIQNVEIMEDSTVTKWSKSGSNVVSKLTTGGTEYKAAAMAFYDDENLYAYDEGLLTDMTYNVFLDQYGYIIGVELYEGTLKYVFITGYDRNESNLSIKTATAAGIFLDGSMSEIQVNVQDTNSNIKDAKNAYYTEWTAGGEYALNRWYTYSVNEAGTYTLKPASMTATYYAADAELNTSNVTVKAALAGVDTTTRVYGEDDSVFITVDTDAVDTTNGRKLAITDVTGVYTGVQNVDLEVDVDAFAYGVEAHVYTVYDKNNYIIGAVALADATGSTANYAYILSGAKSEEIKDGTYYWEFEAVLNGEIQTLTAKSKYKSVINSLRTGDVQELRFDADGYVVKVVDIDDAYDYADAKNEGVDITKYDVYFVDSKDSDTQMVMDDGSNTKYLQLSLQGRTLYITPNQKDMGLALASGAKAVVIQDENGEGDVETEFDSVSAAISYLADPKLGTSALEYSGEIIAVLNSNGTAAWVVFNSSTELTTGSEKPVGPTYSTDAEFRSLAGTTLTYYLEDPTEADLTAGDVEDIFAMLADAGYTNISYNATSGWTFTTPKGLTMTTTITTLTRVVKIAVDGQSKEVVKGTKVKDATGNSYADSANTYIAAGSGYVANNSTVAEGTKYYTDKQYVKFTGTALAGTAADKFSVAYSTASGTALKANDYVAVGETVVTTITAKEVIKNGAGVSTAFTLTATDGKAVYTGELDADTAFTGDGTATMTAKSTTENDAVVVRGDIFTVTADAAVTADADYASKTVTVTLPTT